MAERRLRIGVIGAGMIAQVEHIPNLLHLAERFELAGVADPSAVVRAAIAARYGVRGFATAAELMAESLDAVLVAVPDPLHATTVLAALEAGLHVFCEKPLCFTEAEGAAIAAARDRAGRVVQWDVDGSIPTTRPPSPICPRAVRACATSRSRCPTPTRGRSSPTTRSCAPTTCRPI